MSTNMRISATNRSLLRSRTRAGSWSCQWGRGRDRTEARRGTLVAGCCLSHPTPATFNVEISVLLRLRCFTHFYPSLKWMNLYSNNYFYFRKSHVISAQIHQRPNGQILNERKINFNISSKLYVVLFLITQAIILLVHQIYNQTLFTTQ